MEIDENVDDADDINHDERCHYDGDDVDDGDISCAHVKVDDDYNDYDDEYYDHDEDYDDVNDDFDIMDCMRGRRGHCAELSCISLQG